MISFSRLDGVLSKEDFLVNGSMAKTLVIGVGAVGSSVAVLLSRMGVPNIHLMDGDKVESHNLSNQVHFGSSDLGKNKALALEEGLIKLGCDILALPTYFKANQHLLLGYNFIFCCVDTMAVRKAIFDETMGKNVIFFADSRIGLRSIQLNFADCTKANNRNLYKEGWYPDSDVNDSKSACGSPQALGLTAQIAAGLMVNSFVKYVKGGFSQQALTGEILLDLETLSLQHFSPHLV